MQRVFGRGHSKVPPPSLADVGANIDSRIETLDKKINMLRVEIGKYQQQMKNMPEGPSKRSLKELAVRKLREKLTLENQLKTLSQQSSNMSQTSFALQSVKDTQNTVAVMKTSLKEFKKETKKLDINKIEDLHDDMTDMMELTDEFGDVLGRSVCPGDFNEEDLEIELAALGDEFDASRDSAYLDEAINAPGVPNTAVGGQSLLPGQPQAAKSGEVTLDEFGLPQIP